VNTTILALNAGSSSIKFALYQAAHGNISMICRGKMETRDAASRFQVKDCQGSLLWQQHLDISCHENAIEIL